MLKKLKRKLILIIMTLVGAVLVATMGFSLYSAWSSQKGLIDQSLTHSLEGELNSVPMIGQTPKKNHGGDSQGTSMFALALEISSDGYVLETSNSPVTINASVLDQVIDEIVAGRTAGKDDESHVAWKSAKTDSGSIRIAIVDTRAADASFVSLVRRYVLIIIVALLALFAIAWFLATWSLRPVADAWQRQRRFVADASHELKTPLAVIIANIEILQKDKGIPEESRRWIDSTADEAGHMKSLVNDLLQLARADESASGDTVGAMHMEEIDFSDMVDSAALEFDAVAFERGLEIESDIDEGVKVKGDASWLDRVVRILIDNACKYAERGSKVKVSLHKMQGKGKGQAKARLTVNNRGATIAPEDLAHVFDRFYRSDKARTRTDGTGGFGLGLAIAKSTVEAHHGTISAASNDADGTTFTVTLPLAS